MLHLRFPLLFLLFFFFLLACAFHVGVSISGSHAMCFTIIQCVLVCSIDTVATVDIVRVWIGVHGAAFVFPLFFFPFFSFFLLACTLHVGVSVSRSHAMCFTIIQYVLVCSIDTVATVDIVRIWIGVHGVAFAFSSFFFSFFFYFFIGMRISCGSVCQWVPCTVHGTHHLFNNPNFYWNGTVQWVPYTVHGTHKPLYSVTFSLKMDSMILFTHLKFILL